MAKQNLPAPKAQHSLPAETGDDFAAYAGAGLENVGASDILIPRLTILQALSPQLNKRKAEYIVGAEVGNIADVGTNELFPDGVLFLPVLYRKDYLEWAPRDSGKGLVAVHSSPEILDQCSAGDRSRPTLPNGNYIAETAQFFGFNLSAGGRKCFIPMASTQLKKARRWNTLATGEKLKRSDGSEFTAPLFYRTYKLTTADESNNDGDWAGWVVSRDVALPEIPAAMFAWRSLLREAVLFRESLAKGSARADLQEDPSTEEAM